LFTGEDDNPRRHAGVYAIWDWCWGGDDQWLYSAPEENRLYSHDHGHYLPDGPSWTEQSLVNKVDEPWVSPRPTAGINASFLHEFADRLDAVTRLQLAEVLRAIPTDWDVTQPELEALGFFLERRAPAVAARLRGLPLTV
jgi:hypothetical protein